MSNYRFAQVGKKIIGIGLNYKSLAKVRNRSIPKNPIVFFKPSTAYLIQDNKIQIPKGFHVNQEVELGVIIGHQCKNIEEKQALNYVGSYCLALDLTTIEIPDQDQVNFWSIGKGFDTACPVSAEISKQLVPNPNNVNIWCKINNNLIQNSSTSDFIFQIEAIISFLSKFITLEPNDLILTGSPPGMSEIRSGDRIEAGLDNKKLLEFFVQ